MYYSYKPSRRKKARLSKRFLIFGGIVAAAVVLIWLFVFGGLSLAQTTKIEKSLPENVTAVSEGILYMDSGNLYYDNFSGERIWMYALESDKTSFITSDHMICVYGAQSAQFFDYEKNALFTIQQSAGIKQIKLGHTHAAILSKTKNEEEKEISTLYLFDQSGTQTGQIDLETRNLLSYGIAGEGDMVWTLTLDTSGVVPVSHIATYKTDGTITSSISVNEQIIEKVIVTDNSIYTSGTSSLMQYSYFGEMTNEVLIYGWEYYQENIGETPEEFRLLYISRSEDPKDINAVKMYDYEFNPTTIYFPQRVFYVSVSSSNLYAFANDCIYVYNMNGELIETKELDMNLTNAKKLNNQYTVIWSGTSSQIMNME